MKPHIFLSFALVLTPSIALAQSASGTSFTTAPAKSAPAVGTTKPVGEPKVKIPNAAQSSPDTGLRVGEGAATGQPVEVKRVK